ncbi:DoxX family protein [Microvirga roseola]|uniref:DoxX family protein n=1 Tax=Microvirga roseola TaxID=2883126 RepID=UPI001E4535BA|nr:DoxX family protein [Microvirga roseola]
MSNIFEQILLARTVTVIARVLLTLPFWGSALVKLIDFQGGVAEMAHFGLEPAVAFNIATIVVQTVGSLLVILNWWTWLGAGALCIFTALTIPIAHHFWSMSEEPSRTIAFHTAAEHVGMIGALIIVSLLSAHRISSVGRSAKQASARPMGKAH